MDPIPLLWSRELSRTHARSALPDAPVVATPTPGKQRRVMRALLSIRVRRRVAFGRPQAVLRRSS
jgi:hypothetical protein